eukprot:2394765-Rhodomonas_salina.1
MRVRVRPMLVCADACPPTPAPHALMSPNQSRQRTLDVTISELIRTLDSRHTHTHTPQLSPSPKTDAKTSPKQPRPHVARTTTETSCEPRPERVSRPQHSVERERERERGASRDLSRLVVVGEGYAQVRHAPLQRLVCARG